MYQYFQLCTNTDLCSQIICKLYTSYQTCDLLHTIYHYYFYYYMYYHYSLQVLQHQAISYIFHIHPVIYTDLSVSVTVGLCQSVDFLVAFANIKVTSNLCHLLHHRLPVSSVRWILIGQLCLDAHLSKYGNLYRQQATYKPAINQRVC